MNVTNLLFGGLIMVRCFGLLLALVVSVQSASAALLSTWDFASNANGTVAGGIVGAAGAMQNAGQTSATGGLVYGNAGARNASGFWRTSNFNNVGSASPLSARYSYISFTNNSSVNQITLTTLDFKAKNTSGVFGRNVDVSYKITGVSGESSLGSFERTSSSFSSSTASFATGVTLDAGDSVTVYFRFFKSDSDNNSNNRQLDLDDIALNGDVVPEPASMAVFGLVGLGVAVARRRKK